MSARILLPIVLLIAAGCGGDGPEGRGAPGPGARAAGGRGGPPAPAAAVPVQVAPVERRPISAYIETNGTLEAENEVDIVARVAAPVRELLVEEGDRVAANQVLARLDDQELRAQLEISRVAVDETRQVLERSRRSFDQKLISPEAYEQAKADFEAAKAQFEANRILVGYTEVRAPFRGMIVSRYVDTAEQVSANQALFRISDFDPLLCPIQVPERDLSRLRIGQRAWLEVESWPGERFPATVLRIRPVVDAATGTVKVTLEAKEPERLRPGMFARVYLEAETRPDALVIPKSALSLESIGDTVFVAEGDHASRREVTLGFEEDDAVEVVSGLREGELIVVIGQDGLSDGTPIQILGERAGARAAEDARRGPEVLSPAGGPVGPGFDPADLTPEQIEQIKERMRARGLTEEQIEERLQRMRERAEAGGG